MDMLADFRMHTTEEHNKTDYSSMHLFFACLGHESTRPDFCEINDMKVNLIP